MTKPVFHIWKCSPQGQIHSTVCVPVPPNSQDEGTTCWGDRAAFDVLIVLYVQVGMTPLHYAAQSGRVDAVKVLLSEGAAVDAVSKVIIVNMLSCWQCYSSFLLRVCHIYPERCGCGAAGKHEYGVLWLVGSKERYSVQAPLLVIVAHIVQRDIYKQSEMSKWVERAGTNDLKCEKDWACVQPETWNVGKMRGRGSVWLQMCKVVVVLGTRTVTVSYCSER